MPGAIVIAGPEDQESESERNISIPPSRLEIPESFLAGMEVMGRSVLGRMVQDLSHTRIEELSILVSRSLAELALGDALDLWPYSSRDVWGSAKERLLRAKESGLETVIVVRVGAYVEFDPAELIQFHHDRGDAVTRACDEQGPLDLWVVNPFAFDPGDDLRAMLHAAERPYYPIRGYVNRLENLRDMRRLIVDSLSGRCQFRPQGSEVRPGVWMAEGVQVERGARIVAPAFLGAGTRIAEQSLITRCSCIESNTHVDYGTVLEDSWIMSNTYVGIGLDVSHSVVDGNRLLSLNRDVMLEISDPVVMGKQRQTKGRGGRQWGSDFRVGEMALTGAGEHRQ